MEAATPHRWLPLCAESAVIWWEHQRGGQAVPVSSLVRHDPGLIWQLLCSLPEWASDSPPPWSQKTFAFPDLLTDHPPSWANWNHSTAAQVYRKSIHHAQLAEEHAEAFGIHSEIAFCLGFLIHLGELIASQGLAPLPSIRTNPDGLTRYYVRRCPGPEWFKQAFLHLDLPVQTKADIACWREKLIRLLQFTQQTVRSLRGRGHAEETHSCPVALATDGGALLHRALLAGQIHQREEGVVETAQLETEIEELRTRLGLIHQQEEEHLRNQKLHSMAELAAGAGHEINNPLAVISAQAQFLLRHTKDMEEGQALQRIIKQTGRIHMILRDLMLFARPPVPKFQKTNLLRLVKAVVGEFEEQVLSREVKLDVGKVPAKLHLQADPQLLGTALRCLIQNALDVLPRHGWVRISIAPRAQSMDFMVEDNGPGITQNIADSLFDPFFSGRSAGRGVGMGLSKVWRISDLHHGRIRVINLSQPTQFVLTLPLKQPKVMKKSPELPAVRNVARRKPR